MSIFCLNTEPIKVQEKTYSRDVLMQDRYFLPGILHGDENTLYRVYLNDAHCEGEGDFDQFEIDFITKDLIKEARQLDPGLGDIFYEHLFNAENFCAKNDGESGDFAEILMAWHRGAYMTGAELCAWAADLYAPIKKETYKVVYQEVLQYEFEVESESPEEVLVDFSRLCQESYFDFSDGELIDGRTVKIIAPSGHAVLEDNSFSDLENMAENPTMIKIPLGDGYSLRAERNTEPGYKEIFVYLYNDKEKYISQDLAIVGEHYRYDGEDGNILPVHGVYSVKAYSDPENKDFTHDFSVNRIEDACQHSKESMCEIAPCDEECDK